MALKRPSLLSNIETTLRGWIHTDRGDPDGSAKLDLGQVQGQLSSRAGADMFYIDNATNGARAYWNLGAAGVMGLGDFTVTRCVFVPTSNGKAVGLFCLSSNSLEYGYAGTIGTEVSATGDLAVTVWSVAFTTSRRFTVSGFRNTYGGRFVWITIVRTGATLAVYADATPLSGTQSGSTPDWAVSLPASFLHTHVTTASGAATSLNEHVGGAPLVFNRALPLADVAAFVATGRISFADAAGGSMVPIVSPTTLNGGFETAGGGGLDALANWSESAGGSSTITRDTTEYHSGTASCRLSIDSANSNANISQSLLRIGKRYKLSIWAKTDSAGVAQGARVESDSAGSNTQVTSALTADWVRYELVFVATSTSFMLKRGGTLSTVSIWIDDVELVDLGAILQSQIGRTAQPRDKGPNRIHGLSTPGVTPLPASTPQLELLEYNIAATGFLGADQALYFDAHLIARIRIRATGGTPTVTIRRTSSSGTVVINAQATTLNEWIEATIVGGTREGAAGDKYHITLSAAQNVLILIETNPR